MTPSTQLGRAAVVSRHPATIRRLAQSLGAVGLGVNHSLGTAGLQRYEPGELKIAVLDLDVDAHADPAQLVAELAAACPQTPLVAVAGVDAKRRLMAALGSPSVRHVVPKLGGWIDLPAEKRTFDGPDEQDLAIGLRRHLHPQTSPQGVGPYLIEGFSAQHATVGSTSEKDGALGEVMSMAEALELSDEKKRRIEVATEELLLNAIYDAPRAPDGKPLHAGLDRRTPVTLDERARVALAYGCDGRNFVIAVADGFGSIERDDVVRSLRKLLEPQGPRPQAGTSGAGLGLMLTYSQANQLIVHSVRERFTEVTAVVHVSGSNRTALARGSALHLYLDGPAEKE
ncbi:MAG TPA: hypothetical protein VFF06_23370 [Polyangia bacterium]|nr:hypothetical protein [Polyangia bacterium]